MEDVRACLVECRKRAMRLPSLSIADLSLRRQLRNGWRRHAGESSAGVDSHTWAFWHACHAALVGGNVPWMKDPPWASGFQQRPIDKYRDSEPTYRSSAFLPFG